MDSGSASLDDAPRWRRRKDARPAELLDAAMACFAERGFAATRMDDVAARAGVTKGTVYLYFPGKEELFKAMLREKVVPILDEAVMGARAATDSYSARLERFVGRMVAFITSGNVGAIPKIMIAEAHNFPSLARFYADEVVAQGLGAIERMIIAGIECGEFRPVETGPAAQGLIGPIMLAMIWRHSLDPYSDLEFDPQAIAQTHLDIFLTGLRAPSNMQQDRAT